MLWRRHLTNRNITRDQPIGRPYLADPATSLLRSESRELHSNRTPDALDGIPVSVDSLSGDTYCRLGEPIVDGDSGISLVELAIANPSAHRLQMECEDALTPALELL